MDSVLQDLRYAFRSLRRQLTLTVIVGLTLALGIGMNTAIFSVLYGVMFKPLPYAEPDRLMQIGRTRPELPTVLLPISVANFVELRPKISQFEAVEARVGTSLIIEGDDDADQVFGSYVTTGFFDLLGVSPQLGRAFTAGDGVVGAQKTVVVSDQFWKSRLGADSAVIGTTLRLHETRYTVIGVAAPHFGFRNANFWIPFQWDENDLGNRGSNFLQLFGRLAPGVHSVAANAEVHGLWTALGEEHADLYDDSGMRAEGLLTATVGRSRTPLFILAGAVGLVLLVACANVANLMLAKSESRHREISVRAALGAARGRLVRQFLTESLVLSITGGLAGLLAAVVGVRVLVATFGNAIPRSQDVGINGMVLGFALLVSVLTGVVVGLAPALLAKPDHSALKAGARGASGRITALRKGLVVTEVAMALMLVTGTGLLLKSFWRAQQSDLGFDGNNLLILNLWLPPSRYQNDTERTAFFDALLPQLTALPQVRQAGMINMIPARNFGNNFTTIMVDGRDERESHFVEARRASLTYFETMGIPITRGRGFTVADLADGANAVIINEELRRQLFADDESPLGTRLGGDLGGNPPEIVGVVGDVRGFGPDERPRPAIYFVVRASSNVVLRATADPLQLVPQVRQAIAGIDPAVRVYRTDTMTDILDRSLGDRQFQLTLLLIFAGVALVLGSVGIYGVMSHTVAQRTRELGVRLALGATTGGVLRLVLGQGILLAGLGVALGTAGTFAGRRVLANALFDVSATDPVTYIAVAGLLLAVAALACYVPARRAASVDPMVALRYE